MILDNHTVISAKESVTLMGLNFIGWMKESFSQSGFMPHGHCYLWKPLLVSVHAVSDFLIGIAYLGISITLYGLIKKINLPFNRIVVFFGLFIGACGLTHLLEVWNLWYADYWLSAFVKAVTAMASVGTGVYLFRLRHTILNVARASALAEERKKELEVLNKELEKRVEDRAEQLKKAESKFQDTFEFAAIGLAHVGLDGKWLRVNSRFSQIIGYTTEELSGKTFADITYPEDLEKDWALAMKLLHKEIPSYTMDKRYIHKNGHIVWVKLTAALSTLPDGVPDYFIACVDEITALKAAEEKLKASEEKFRLLHDTMVQGVVYQDKSGQVVSMNHAAEVILGKDLQEFAGQTSEDVEHHTKKDDGSIFPGNEHPSMVALKTGQMVKDIVMGVFNPKLQEYRWINITAVPLFHGPDKGPNQVYTVFEDITLRRENERALKAAISSRDEFMSVASHELRTPLTSLKLRSQLFASKVAKNAPGAFDPSEMKILMNYIDRATSRLARLVDDMLDISKINSGKLEMRIEQFDLSELLHDVVEQLSYIAQSSDTTLKLVSTGPIKGSWDKLRIEQVIINLIMNAIRYGEKRPVEIVLQREGNIARVIVSDQGKGISEENFERIFRRFERAVSANEISGLGLGLYIAREIVLAHKGRIWAESEGIGKGSRFIVELNITS